MAKYRYTESTDITGIIDQEQNIFIPPNSGVNWQKYEDWKALGNTPDPQLTAEEIAENDYQERQAARLQTLINATIDQFDMILALYQVGRDNGVWVATDFDEELRTKAAEWRTLIDEYRADTP